MNPNLRYIGNEANFLKNIGFRIQFFRKKSGLSQEELAEKSGLSYSTISHIESSTPYPMSMVAIYRIANALDVAPYQLLKFVLASGDNRHSGSGEKGQFWSNEKRHLQIE